MLSYPQKLGIFLLLRALFLALVIVYSGIGLFPDEAQYWTWSQDLDFGYYSKPPGIAWQIWLTTSLFGATVFGVRVGALFVGTLLAVAVYLCAHFSAVSKRAAFWAALIAAFSPLGIYLSIAATTDGGSVLFFTMAAALVCKGIREERGPRYLIIGVLIFCGALFKWTTFIFWIVLLPYLFFYKNLRKKSLAFAILFSLLALLPSLYWNLHHDFATLRHVGSTVGSGRGGNPFSYTLSQAGLLFPLFFFFLLLGVFALRRVANPALKFQAGFLLAALGYCLAACFKKVQVNWAFYLYPAALPIAGWFACQWHKRWRHIALMCSIGTICVIFLLPQLKVPFALNPFRHALGWDKMDLLLHEAGYRPQTDVLVADKYQTASLLSFYGEEQKRAFFMNLGLARKNQFSYWPQVEKGQDGYFVVVEQMKGPSINWYALHYREKLSPYFETSALVAAEPLYSVRREPVKYALIFKCTGYLGISPPDAGKY